MACAVGAAGSEAIGPKAAGPEVAGSEAAGPEVADLKAGGGASSPLLRNAAKLGGVTLASRVMGLARDMSMAWLLGNGPAADALAAAMRLPHALRRLLAEGSLSMTLTADFVHCRTAGEGKAQTPAPTLAQIPTKPASQTSGISSTPVLAQAMPLAVSEGMPLPASDPAANLVAALTPRLACALLLLTLACMAAAPWLTAVLTPGFSAGQRAESAELLRICLLYVPFAGMAGLGMAVLHSRGHFRRPALSPVLFNSVALIFAAAAALGLGPVAPLLAWGLVAGGLGQWLLQQWPSERRIFERWPFTRRPFAWSHGLRISCAATAKSVEHKDFWARAARQKLLRLPLGVLGAAAPQLAMLVAMIPASLLGQGRVSALYYAERLLELPLGVIGVCLGMAGLPLLSRLAAEQNFTAFTARFAETQRVALLLSLPAMAGLWAIGPELVDALLRRGAFDARAAHETALALGAYLPGLPAFALIRIRLAACNALHEIRGPALTTMLAVLVVMLAGHGFLLVLPADLAGAGPALAVSLGLWSQSLLLGRCLRQKLPVDLSTNVPDNVPDNAPDNVPATSAMTANPLRPLPSASCCSLWTWATLRHLVAAGITGLAARYTLALMYTGANPEAPLWASLTLAIVVGFAAWLVTLGLLRDPDARMLFDAVCRRKRCYGP